MKHLHWVGLGLILMAAGGLVLAGALYERAYAGRIYPGVRVLGMEVGGATYARTRAMTSERATAILDQPITLIYGDGATELVTPRRLSLELDLDQLVSEAYRHGRTGPFWARWWEIWLLRSSGAALAFAPAFDTDKILAALENSFVAHEQPAEDAALVADNGTLAIQPEKNGRRIDRAAFSSSIETAFASLRIPPEIEVPSETVAPTITAAALEPLLAEAQRLVDVPLTLLARDRTFTVAAATLTAWVRTDTSRLPATLAWSREAIETYLGKVARGVDAPMQPRKINVQNGAVLEEGEVGWKLDRAAATEAILKALKARDAGPSLAPIPTDPVTLAVTELPIEEKTITPPFTPGLYAGKYIEINLLEQMLYQWEGTNMLASYQVSTGKWSFPTPEGVLYIKNHISYAYSRKYNLYMPWWMGLSFNPDGSNYQGYGIHELPEWKGGKKEGESHLGTPVSHGCIRLGVGPAKSVYDWADEGMPVYIHK